ncbi:DJ-1/PfpI family protein [Halosaccharopolyspora lacisalsi]|uniref:DJ-1/PfpI family protein n=1 Tax=Halosaccharopolyspora lacisalsi TaxID=1000566 RepID=UPI001C71CCBA
MLVVLFEGVQSLDVTGPSEVFAAADRWRTSRGGGPAYDVSTAGLGGHPVRTSSGLPITPDVDLHRAREPDVLLVPGGEGTCVPDQDLVAWLRRQARQVVSVCTGALRCARVPSCSPSPACCRGDGIPPTGPTASPGPAGFPTSTSPRSRFSSGTATSPPRQRSASHCERFSSGSSNARRLTCACTPSPSESPCRLGSSRVPSPTGWA